MRDIFGKVAVLFGGRSAERAISLQSGENILAALKRQGIDAHPLDLDENIADTLVKAQFARVFIALHGREGEDGVVQGLLQMLGIPFTGSRVGASALAMDKARAKWLMRGAGVATPPFGVVQSVEEAKKVAQNLGFPVSVKPVYEGSSIGISRVAVLAELAEAYSHAAQYGQVMIEKWIEGKDFTVGFVNERVLPSIEVRAQSLFYNYEAKYESDNTEYVCPSCLSPQKEAEVQALAQRAFQALGCEGWGRVDLIQDSQEQFWVLEVNTIPGMTSHSLVPTAAKAIGIAFDQLVVEILKTTLTEQQDNLSNRFVA